MVRSPVGRFDGYRGFRPGPVQTLGFLALLPALLGLGCWQLQRADQKTELLAALASARSTPPVAVQGLAPSPMVPQRAWAKGRYASEQLLLDNRISNGRAGYELLTPLLLDDGRAKPHAVLVNRGWLALGPDRSVLPAVSAPEGPVEISGLALVPSPAVFKLSDSELFGTGWPLVIQSLDLERIATRLGYALLPVVLYPEGSQAAQALAAALSRFPPERHLAYAAQWFAIASVLVSLYLWHGLRRAAASKRIGPQVSANKRR